jgi:hypothetical protein
LRKRKRAPSEERRRDQVEINLLAESQDRGGLAKARRGCTLPFLGGSLLIIVFEVVHIALT